MRVFTHYYQFSESDGLRWRTLLQFGNSWEIIGSVVMKNPGSAKFKYPSHEPIRQTSLLSELKKFDDGKDYGEWYEFGDDDTLRKTRSLFAQYQQFNYQRPLEGVVQIFNLFYLRDADLGRALARYKVQDNSITEGLTHVKDAKYDIDHLEAPVYLGFSGLAFDKEFTDKAMAFYDKACSLGMNYCDSFKGSKFTHPQALMGTKSHDPLRIKEKCAFLMNKPISTVTDEDIKATSGIQLQPILPKAIFQMVHDYLVREGYEYAEKNKNVRFLFGKNTQKIEVTLEPKNGIVYIRHSRRPYYNYSREDAPNYSLIKEKLYQLDYDTESLNVWMGRKPFDRYGSCDNQIAERIISELQELNAYFDFLDWQ